MLSVLRTKFLLTILFVIIATMLIFLSSAFLKNGINVRKYNEYVVVANQLGYEVEQRTKSQTVSDDELTALENLVQRETNYNKKKEKIAQIMDSETIVQKDLYFAFYDVKTANLISFQGDKKVYNEDFENILIEMEYAYYLDNGKVDLDDVIYYSPSQDNSIGSGYIKTIDNFEYATIKDLLFYLDTENDEIAKSMLYHNLSDARHNEFQAAVFNQILVENDTLFISISQIVDLCQFLYDKMDEPFYNDLFLNNRVAANSNTYIFDKSDNFSITITTDEFPYFFIVYSEDKDNVAQFNEIIYNKLKG